jgi:hypothetical protein
VVLPHLGGVEVIEIIEAGEGVVLHVPSSSVRRVETIGM